MTDPDRWRSILVADLDGQATRRPTRLLWHAGTVRAFTGSTDLAALFARHATLALSTVAHRHHLEQAIEARTVTGRATGILMNRYQLTAERAFEVLRRYSQDRNIKVRDLAEALITEGRLPD